MREIVSRLKQKLEDINLKMMDPAVLSNQKKIIELNRKRLNLIDTLKAGEQYLQTVNGIEEAREVIKTESDADLVEMAREELAGYEARFEAVEKEFKFKLLPRDPEDAKSAMIEIRAGTGGDEAALFASDIFRMYQHYADIMGWNLEILSSNSSSGLGGFKEIIFSLSGDMPYGRMKYESGVHRVQRVPLTENQGRIHTSAISVAVFPEAEEVDVTIQENEIKVDVYRSSGPGGQSVNTTDSAVRITHIPTGLVVTCQDEKSQIKNRAKAMKVLRSRLYDQQMSARQAKIAAERKSMVSSGDRSAKIRTYNYPQSRVTDHRINLTLYKLDEILSGQIDVLIDALIQHDQEKLLAIQQEEQEA